MHNILLQGAENKFSIVELEALAIVLGIRYYSSYLNNGKPFKILTDNRALIYVYQGYHKSRNPKLLRYSLELQGRDYNISHVPGAQHSHVDAISRFPYRWLSRLEGTLKKFNARAVEDMEETALKLRAPDDANLLQLSKWNDNDGEIKNCCTGNNVISILKFLGKHYLSNN